MQEKLFTKGFNQTELREHAKDFLQSSLNWFLQVRSGRGGGEFKNG